MIIVLIILAASAAFIWWSIRTPMDQLDRIMAPIAPFMLLALAALMIYSAFAVVAYMVRG